MNIDPLTMTDKAICTELGSRIKELRLQQNKRQADVCEQTGISLDTIKRLEKGQGKLSTMIAVLRALKMLHEVDSFIAPVTLDPIAISKMHGKIRQRGSKP